MPLLHTLHRHRRLLGRQVLLWFVLALGVAVATPLLRPKSLEQVCSASGGLRWVALPSANAQPGDNPDAAPAPHTLDCVLCLHLDVPLPQEVRHPGLRHLPPRVAAMAVSNVPARAPLAHRARAPPVVS